MPFATARADTSALRTTSLETTNGPSHDTRSSDADAVVPSADPVPGTLTINTGGDRVGGDVAGAAGAVFSLYTDADLTVPATPATCGPTNASGVCSVSLPPGTFYAVETTAPLGFETLPQLATDPDDTPRDYTNKIGPITITSGNNLTIPNNTGLSTSDYNYNSGKYANRRVNPPLPSVCGFNIALVLDMSGSIDDTEFGQMKAAADDFVTSLGGTPSSVGVYPFATAAPAAGNTNLAATSVSTAAGVATVTNAIDTLVKPTDGSSTNWDAALAQIPSGYDLVMVLTDGNPTVDSTSLSPIRHELPPDRERHRVGQHGQDARWRPRREHPCARHRHRYRCRVDQEPRRDLRADRVQRLECRDGRLLHDRLRHAARHARLDREGAMCGGSRDHEDREPAGGVGGPAVQLHRGRRQPRSRRAPPSMRR